MGLQKIYWRAKDKTFTKIQSKIVALARFKKKKKKNKKECLVSKNKGKSFVTKI